MVRYFYVTRHIKSTREDVYCIQVANPEIRTNNTSAWLWIPNPHVDSQAAWAISFKLARVAVNSYFINPKYIIDWRGKKKE